MTALEDTTTTIEPASSAILIRDGRILMIRRKNPPSYDMFAFPGGRAETGEEPAQTAIRELEEETGIRGHSPQLFAFYDLTSENPGRHFHLSVFLVQADAGESAEARDDAADAGWYTPAEIRALNAPESVKECADRIESELLGSRSA
ncbi:NUDIX domain-containing protein [Rhizobium sp. KVB221]|uniref:NUDIX domain-containing protein n=2 Tax=Rhizobium setariae TaxID=2801340 RepID=A0A936YRE3_9HYPH|nr:NUDIX domain-containing protein [Rhizobium setariae]